MIDCLSNIVATWKCIECNGENEKIKYEKRNLITCKICKGLRRKQEHFVQFANL